MSDKPPPPRAPVPATTVPPPATIAQPPRRTATGEHHAVRAYRDKLESVNEHQVADLAALDEELQKFLESCSSEPPPGDDEDDVPPRKDPR